MDLLKNLGKCIRNISKRNAICLVTAALLFSACGNNPKPNEPDSIKTEQTDQKSKSDSTSDKTKSQNPSEDRRVRRLYQIDSSLPHN